MVKLVLNWSDVHYYTVSNVENFAPSDAGVYKLLYLLANKPRLFYVGQAEDLRKTLLNHLSDTEPNICIRRNFWYYTCYFQFAGVASQSERDGAERALYDHYKPLCNTVPPKGEPYDINFD
jgi:excinuclease UvrABC nuclease subunit